MPKNDKSDNRNKRPGFKSKSYGGDRKYNSGERSDRRSSGNSGEGGFKKRFRGNSEGGNESYRDRGHSDGDFRKKRREGSEGGGYSSDRPRKRFRDSNEDRPKRRYNSDGNRERSSNDGYRSDRPKRREDSEGGSDYKRRSYRGDSNGNRKERPRRDIDGNRKDRNDSDRPRRYGDSSEGKDYRKERRYGDDSRRRSDRNRSSEGGGDSNRRRYRDSEGGGDSNRRRYRDSEGGGDSNRRRYRDSEGGGDSNRRRYRDSEGGGDSNRRDRNSEGGGDSNRRRYRDSDRDNNRDSNRRYGDSDRNRNNQSDYRRGPRSSNSSGAKYYKDAIENFKKSFLEEEGEGEEELLTEDSKPKDRPKKIKIKPAEEVDDSVIENRKAKVDLIHKVKENTILENSRSESDSTELPEEMRINRYLARCGLGARRSVEEFILSGRVAVNGETIEDLSRKIHLSTDQVTLDGNLVTPVLGSIIIVFNKPAGYLCSHTDAHHDTTIFKLLPEKYHRLNIGGRLDLTSRGLMVLSSDGNLIFQLTHPSHKIAKEYVLQVDGLPEEEELKESFYRGITDSGEVLRAKDVSIIDKEHGIVSVILLEGKKRQLHRMFQNIGCTVTDLQRIRIGKLKLAELSLKEGEYKVIQKEDIFAEE